MRSSERCRLNSVGHLVVGVKTRDAGTKAAKRNNVGIRAAKRSNVERMACSKP